MHHVSDGQITRWGVTLSETPNWTREQGDQLFKHLPTMSRRKGEYEPGYGRESCRERQALGGSPVREISAQVRESILILFNQKHSERALQLSGDLGNSLFLYLKPLGPSNYTSSGQTSHSWSSPDS